MNYVKIDYCDMCNGPGYRVSLFVSGCRNHCDGCFNKQTWNFDAGIMFLNTDMLNILAAMSNPKIKGLSVLGGDPFQPENINEVEKLCHAVKTFLPNKTIWLWTGYSFEDFKQHQIMKYIDVIVDGRFMSEKYDRTLKYKGSSNQRVIDVQKTIKTNKIILLEE